jgi:hypothetical protein
MRAEDVDPAIAAALNLPTLESTTADLLNACQNWVRRYVILSAEQPIILAAWILHTWAFDASEITPYIHITAPEKACGKSRLMDVLAALAAKPAQSSGMTAAALVRCVDRDAPTIFLDEVDTQVAGDKEIGEAIRGILNAGSQRGGKFYKCDGKQHSLREFNVFSPKCYAGIGHIWDTVSSRSIAIEMRRKLRGESVERFRQRDVNAAALPLKRQLEAWSQMGSLDKLLPMRPAEIQGISDRQNDMAEPLLAIAELAGAEWRECLTAALLSVFSSQRSEDASIGVTLLSDIRDAFEDRRADRLTSASLLEYLNDIDGRPWPEWNRGKPMTTSNLARQLKKHNIQSGTIRLNGETAKGYYKGDFREPWARYCPCPSTHSESASQTSQTSRPTSSLAENDHASRHIVVTKKDEAVTHALFGDTPTSGGHPARLANVTAVTDEFMSRNSGSPHKHCVVTAVTTATANRGNKEESGSEVRI